MSKGETKRAQATRIIEAGGGVNDLIAQMGLTRASALSYKSKIKRQVFGISTYKKNLNKEQKKEPKPAKQEYAAIVVEPKQQPAKASSLIMIKGTPADIALLLKDM